MALASPHHPPPPRFFALPHFFTLQLKQFTQILLYQVLPLCWSISAPFFPFSTLFPPYFGSFPPFFPHSALPPPRADPQCDPAANPVCHPLLFWVKKGEKRVHAVPGDAARCAELFGPSSHGAFGAKKGQNGVCWGWGGWVGGQRSHSSGFWGKKPSLRHFHGDCGAAAAA